MPRLSRDRTVAIGQMRGLLLALGAPYFLRHLGFDQFLNAACHVFGERIVYTRISAGMELRLGSSKLQTPLYCELVHEWPQCLIKTDQKIP
jgi:hypothetical protein